MEVRTIIRYLLFEEDSGADMLDKMQSRSRENSIETEVDRQDRRLVRKGGGTGNRESSQ